MKTMVENCFSIVVTILACVPSSGGAPVSDSIDTSWYLTHPVVLVLCVCGLLLCAILFLVQCGGCTEMEVGTESHPAAGGGGKSIGAAVTYASPMDTNYDCNTGGTGHGLPYSLNPNVNTTQGFAGYQSPGENNIAGYGNIQTAGSYQAPMSPSAPTIQTQGYQVQNPPNAPGPHAHRPAVEPPPPSYNESVGGSGWLTRGNQ